MPTNASDALSSGMSMSMATTPRRNPAAISTTSSPLVQRPSPTMPSAPSSTYQHHRVVIHDEHPDRIAQLAATLHRILEGLHDRAGDRPDRIINTQHPKNSAAAGRRSNRALRSLIARGRPR